MESIYGIRHGRHGDWMGSSGVFASNLDLKSVVQDRDDVHPGDTLLLSGCEADPLPMEWEKSLFEVKAGSTPFVTIIPIAGIIVLPFCQPTCHP